MEEADSDPVHTALREAREEIDLQRSRRWKCWGSWKRLTLPSGFAIAPVLGVMESLPVMSANPGEVAEIFSIPLSLVNDLSRYQVDFLERDGKRRDFYILEHKDYYIWGATANMLRTLALMLNPDSEA